VKLTADGNVKVLDFGLAKALEAPTPAGGKLPQRAFRRHSMVIFFK
jgi:hypothetical protein